MFQKIKYSLIVAILMFVGQMSLPRIEASTLKSESPFAGSWFLPWVGSDFHGWDSIITIKNSSTAFGIYWVSIRDATGLVVTTFSDWVPPYGIARVKLAGSSGMLSNTYYSASVALYTTDWVSGLPSVVTTIGMSSTDGTLEYTGDNNGQGSSTSYAPLVMSNYYGWNTILNFQNMGASTQTVTVTLGTGAVYTFTVFPYSSGAFPASNYLLAGTLTSAKVTISGGNNVAVSTIHGSSGGRAFGNAGISQQIVNYPFVPIFWHLTKNYYGSISSVTCVNTSPYTIDAQFDYYPVTGGSYTSIVPNVPPLGTASVYIPSAFSTAPDGQGSGNVHPAGRFACVVYGDDTSLAAVDYAWAYAPQDAAPIQPYSFGIAGNLSNSYLVSSNWMYGWSPTPGTDATQEIVSMEEGDWECYQYGVAPPYLCNAFGYQQHTDPNIISMCPGVRCPTLNNSRWVLGFNEPDNCASGGSCIAWAEADGYSRVYSVDRAVRLWSKHQSIYSGSFLVSPGFIDSTTAPLLAFRNAYNSLYGAMPRFDAIAIHCGISYCRNPEVLPAQVNFAKSLTPSPEVWVTEFANDQWSGDCNASVAQLRELMKYFSYTPTITKFSTSMANGWPGFCPLWNGSTLTSMGQAYWMYR